MYRMAGVIGLVGPILISRDKRDKTVLTGIQLYAFRENQPFGLCAV